MQFSENEIERFAAWSGDHNPFHIDPESARGAGFPQPVVHGILAVFGALGSVYPHAAEPLTTLDIDFRAPVLANVICDVGWVRGPEEFSATIRQRGLEVLTIGSDSGSISEPPAKPDLAWFHRLEDDCHAQERVKRIDSADRDLGEYKSALEVSGVYTTDPPPEAATASGYLTPIQARILGLCSYLIGMELPGLRSLFLRASLCFRIVDVDSNQLWYRIRTKPFDPETRTLDGHLEVATPDGQLLATGTLQSYVRFTPVNTDLDTFVPRLPAAGSRLAGKIALVCGGSRGLGADLTAALALAGCHVYAGYRRASATARRLEQRLAERDVHVEFLEGDVGDPTWCDRALEIIRAGHGRLDVLALNACASPAEFPLSAGSVAQFDEYLRANLRLACTPLATFLPLLEQSGGGVVCISSAMVTDPQPGYAHHVALKQAVEGMVQTATRESPKLWTLIVRPPRLLTSWNDTPARVAGAIPSSAVACSVVNRLAGEWHPGQVELLAERFSDVAQVFCSHSAPEKVQASAVADFEECETPDRFADAGKFEPLETADLDADAILISIDALIAAELTPPPAMAENAHRILSIGVEQRLLPDLAEIDHWHEADDHPVCDTPVASQVINSEPTATEQPAVGRLPDAPNSIDQISAEQELFDFLSEMQSDVEKSVGFCDHDEICVEDESHDDESVLFQDESQLPETLPMLDVFDAAVPTAETDSCNAAVLSDALLASGPAAASESVVAPLEAESRIEPVPYEITGSASLGEEDIAVFEQRAWPEQRPNRVGQRWNWLHVESARRLSVEPQVWQYREGGAVVAHAGAIAVKLRIAGQDSLAAWIVAALPLGADQSETAGAQLLARAGEETSFGLYMDPTGRMRQSLLTLGWVELPRLETAELIIHPDAVLQRKHPGATTLSDWGWRAATAVRTLFHHRARLDVQQVTRFEARHDRLWEIAARDGACGVVRDASYLNWRYVDQPADEFLRLEVIDGHSLRGVVVLTFREATDMHPYRHAILADLVAPLADVEALAPLFEIASAAAAERDADALLCEHAGPVLTRALRQNGFLTRESGRFLLANPAKLSAESGSGSKVLSGADWLIMPGDVDFGE